MSSLVSIITPMYCGERFVAQTIESVRAQTYSRWEMIIIDDASPDNGAGIAIVKKFSETDPRIRLIELKQNKGSSGARNAGIREASGDYIALLDSDDLWDPRFLESQVAFAHTNDAALVYASYRLINEEGAEIMSPYHVKQQVTYTDLLKQNDIGCLTALYCVRKIGKQYLNENLGSVRDDFELWLRILKEISLAYGNNEILASYRVMKSSTTGNKIKMLIPQWKVYRESEKLSFFLSVYYLLRWAVAGIMKYRKSFTS